MLKAFTRLVQGLSIGLFLTIIMLVVPHAVHAQLVLDVITTYDNPTPAVDDFFGSGLGVVGDRVVIGARGDDTAGIQTGSVYVFEAVTGTLVHSIPNPTPSPNDGMGVRNIAEINGDFVVGDQGDDLNASDSGSVFKFSMSTGNLLQTFPNPIPQNTGSYGYFVTTHNGNIFATAAQIGIGAGVVWMLDGATGTVIRQFPNPTPANDARFGTFIAAQDNLVYIYNTKGGATTNDGSLDVFEIDTGNFVHSFTDPTGLSGGSFGQTAIPYDDRVLITASTYSNPAASSGAAFLYDANTQDLLCTMLNPNSGDSSRFGATSTIVGDYFAIGAPEDNTDGVEVGRVYLYDRTTCQLLGTITSPHPTEDRRFGDNLKTYQNNLIVTSSQNSRDASRNGRAYLISVTGFPQIVYGDLSGDGQVTSIDASQAARFSVGLLPCFEIDPACP